MALEGLFSGFRDRLTPEDAKKFEVGLEQGRIECESKDYKKAVEYLEKVMNESSGGKIPKKSLQMAHVYLGKCLDGLGRYDEASRHFDSAIELDSKSHLAWFHKGCSLFEQKAYDKAVKHFEKALALSPKFYDALLRKADALLLAGELEKAVESYNKAVEVGAGGDYARKQIEKAKEEMEHREEREKLRKNEKWSMNLLKR